MSIVLMIFGAFFFLGLLMAAIAAVAMWIWVLATFLAFLIGGSLTVALFGAGQLSFLLGGAGAVVLLWSVLAYKGGYGD